MERNNQLISVLGAAFIDERARFAAGHRRVVMDEQVLAIQRLAHEGHR